MKQVKITLVLDSKKTSCAVPLGATVGGLLKEKGLNPQVFLSTVNNRLAHEKDALREGDEVAFLKVIYGG